MTLNYVRPERLCWRSREGAGGYLPARSRLQAVPANTALVSYVVFLGPVHDEMYIRPATPTPDQTQAAANNAAHDAVASDATGVTSLAMDAPVIVETRVPKTLAPDVAGSILPDQIRTVSEYLSKPFLVASGSWATSAITNASLYSGDVVPMMMSNAMWREKLQGYYGARFTTVLRLTLNGTPFHAGAIRMGYYPAPEINPNKVFEHTQHFISFNQLPGVYLTPAEESVVLKIPYASPLRFVELTSTTRVSPARVEARVFLPLTVGSSGSPSITWNLWMSFEDVQLFGQSATVVAQSSVPAKRPKIRQSRNQSEAEHTPVSSFLSGVAQAVEPLSTIPSIGPFVGPTQWMLNAAALTAGALGWSKPAHDDMNNRVSRSNHWNLPSATGTDNAQKLSLFSDNKLMVLDDTTIGGEDQCSIAFIKRQWAPWATTPFATSNTVGQQVFQCELNPSAYWLQDLGTDFYTPIKYLSEHFLFYRGSLEFKFMFAKTAFHAGQIQFSFIPGPCAAVQLLADTPKAYRLVFDFQDADEVCLRVPYVVPHDYMYRDQSFGRLFIHVLTPLRAPETCAQSVLAGVFVRGGSDYEVATPRLFDKTPGSQPPPALLEAQGGAVEVSGDLCHTMGEDDPLGSTIFSGHSQGEHVSSLLTLLKRYEQVVYPSVDNTKFALLCPWTIFSTRNANVYRSDRHSSILSCFAFMRGGVRLRFVNLVPGVQPTYVENWNNGPAAEWYTSLTLSRSTDAPFAVVTSRAHYDVAGEGGAVAYPYQSRFRFCPTQWNSYVVDTVPSGWHPSGTVAWRGFATGDDSKSRLLMRAFDDDFQPIFWVGVPPHRTVTV